MIGWLLSDNSGESVRGPVSIRSVDQLGSYRLRKRLAVGGMGEVYLGEKIGPEGFVKPVVLKCVLPQLAKDRAFVQLFLDEARLAALLNHPNIAQVYDFGLVDNIYYIAMEYVPGYTVDDIRRKLKSIGQHMPLTHVANVASQVCQGLHYAHTLTDANGVGLGLVHRDVSPHNLIVSIDGSVKIVDFGIAKARAGLTRVQAKGAVGKFGYMSPEQSRGETVDARSDTFSLGVCLWELCTNERLHDPKIERAPEYSPSRPVPQIDQYRTEIPRQFQQILETALSIQSEDRYRSMQDMHLALERFQAAMTHYAGQSALAQYIKDLVEGRVEKPEDNATGEVVMPASRTTRPGSVQVGASTSSGMDAAQKYEEVFGVTVPSKRNRPTIKAVPKSWETREASGARSDGSEPRTRSGAKLVRMQDSAEGLELAEPMQRSNAPSIRRSSLPTPLPRSHRSYTGLFGGLFLLLLVGIGVVAFVYRAHIPELWAQIQPMLPVGDSSSVEPTTMYRIESTPVGATVYVDGERKKGVTPLEVELMPGLRQRIMVRMKGFATQEQHIEAKPNPEVLLVKFDLPKAGRLRVKSVPPGATVTVDGRVIEDRVTPMVLDDVPAGKPFKVRIEIKGLPPRIQSVKVPSRKQRTINVDLTRG